MSTHPGKKCSDLNLDQSHYVPPQEGLLSYLPSSLVPYAELIRLTRPVGIIVIHCPFLFGTLFATAISQQPPTPGELLELEAIQLVSTIFLRGCVVAFNDLADGEIDGKVARTRHRPIARKAISPFAGYIFVLAQAGIWLVILALSSPICVYCAITSLVLAALDLFSKPVTDFTPVVLGFTIALGVFIGCAATDTDPISLAFDERKRVIAAALCTLYLCCAICTIIYEIIYARQDVVDDEKQGVRSMAVRLKSRAKGVLSFLAILQTVLLACACWLMGTKLMELAGPCAGVSLSLGVITWKADLKQLDYCWWWFANGVWFVGRNIILAFLF